MSIIWWIIIILYILSAIISYFYIRYEYSSKGPMHNSTPDGWDTFRVFCPVINTLVVIVQTWNRIDLDNINTSNFFRIKKEERNG